MNKEKNAQYRWKRDAIIAAFAGGLVTVSVGAVAFVMGHLGDAEARRLLEAIIPTSRLFCSSLLTVSATILALMLTLIGLGSRTDLNLADAHYHRILKIAFYDSLLFGAAAVMFVLHCVPVYESDALPGWWYPSIYYGIVVLTSILAGGAVAIIALLYLAVVDLVEVIGLEVEDHYLTVDQSDASQPNDSQAES